MSLSLIDLQSAYSCSLNHLLAKDAINTAAWPCLSSQRQIPPNPTLYFISSLNPCSQKQQDFLDLQVFLLFTLCSFAIRRALSKNFYSTGYINGLIATTASSLLKSFGLLFFAILDCRCRHQKLKEHLQEYHVINFLGKFYSLLCGCFVAANIFSLSYIYTHTH